MNEYNFGWGLPICVREALEIYYKRAFSKINLSMDYAPDEGFSELITLTRNFIKYTIGLDYKYILITNGTTGALNTVLRVLKKDFDTCYTHQYHFPYYPQIIQKNNYFHKTGLYKNHESELAQNRTLAIVDSPSNPEGDLLLYSSNNNIIWDSVYHNQVYINSIPVYPEHRVNCGSYSKVLGLTGLRIGWIATNNEEDYKLFLKENLYENCTISVPSQELLLGILKETDLHNFMLAAKYRINNNREQFNRISYLFDKQEVPENGMFYCAWGNPKILKILNKLNIKYVELDQLGNDKLIRFNLAQNNELTKKAIRFILSEDKI